MIHSFLILQFPTVGKAAGFHSLEGLSQRTFVCSCRMNGEKKTILGFLAISFMISTLPDGQATFLPTSPDRIQVLLCFPCKMQKVNTMSSGEVRQCSQAGLQIFTFLTGSRTVFQATVGNLEDSSLHWEFSPGLYCILTLNQRLIRES